MELNEEEAKIIMYLNSADLDITNTHGVAAKFGINYYTAYHKLKILLVKKAIIIQKGKVMTYYRASEEGLEEALNVLKSKDND